MNPNSNHAGRPARNLASSPRAANLPETRPEIDALITRALSRAPEVRIPDNFATVTAQRALAQPLGRRSPWLGWGPGLAMGSFGLLTAGMFAFAPHATPSLSNLRFDAELVALLELWGLLLFSHRLFSQD